MPRTVNGAKNPPELPLISAGPDEIYDAIEDLILNKAKQIRLGKEGRKFTETYNDFNTIIDQFIKVYERLFQDMSETL